MTRGKPAWPSATTAFPGQVLCHLPLVLQGPPRLLLHVLQSLLSSSLGETWTQAEEGSAHSITEHLREGHGSSHPALGWQYQSIPGGWQAKGVSCSPLILVPSMLPVLVQRFKDPWGWPVCHELGWWVLVCEDTQLNILLCCVQPTCSVMSDSLQPHGLYPPRLPCSWDSPGKNTGVGCHALL